jgi:F-type H+-transporting ATPase subunit delta
MQAASREALTQVRTEVDSVLGRFSSTDGMTGLAQELYAVAGLLTGAPPLRRRLADPASPVEARTGLLGRLLEGKVSASALTVTTAAVSQRWSKAWDLVDALELGGDEVLLAAAEKTGTLDNVEDELFRLERVIDSESAFATLLDETSAPADRRVQLLNTVIGSKVSPLTLALAEHAVVTERKRSIRLALDDLLEGAAARRERSVARVVSAVAMTDAQQSALAAKLSEIYGRRIDVRYGIDSSIRGGLVVRVGDEVIDGSITTRLIQIRGALSG